MKEIENSKSIFKWRKALNFVWIFHANIPRSSLTLKCFLQMIHLLLTFRRAFNCLIKTVYVKEQIVSKQGSGSSSTLNRTVTSTCLPSSSLSLHLSQFVPFSNGLLLCLRLCDSIKHFSSRNETHKNKKNSMQIQNISFSLLFWFIVSRLSKEMLRKNL